MDHNDILAADREGRLPDFSLADLREMRKICARHLQNQNSFMVQPCASVEREILRKEAQEAEHRAEQRHQTLVAEQQRLKAAIESLAKPHWVIWATFVAGAIAAIAALILLLR